ncbi:VanW family protein [Lysobacter terrae]
MRDAADRKRPRRYPHARALQAAPVLAEFESPLWPHEENDAALVVGKIQNLRVAVLALHGVEVPADAVFGFWKQLGRATQGRGFVVGRELREGCLIPSVGGGLCQLSNAIYDCAARAGLSIVERHRHSRIISGSLAEHDRDATVFWNYVDLRLRGRFAWRLEATMDTERLRVRIRGVTDAPTSLPVAVASRAPKPDDLGDCHGCGQVDCHRHAGPQESSTRRAWWLPSAWPEFATYLARERTDADRVFGNSGEPLPQQHGLHRWSMALHWRLARWQGQPLPQIAQAQARREARLLAQQLETRDTRVVVPQALLPFLWREGALAGRHFDVWMTALPMAALQQQLDQARQLYPHCRSLGDFRAPDALIEAETEALAAAGTWISPHAQVCALAGAKARAVPWQCPPASGKSPHMGARRIFFAASPLARKGVFELLAAMRDQAVEILLPPGDSEPELDAGRAQLRRVASYREGLNQADVAVLPAWVEHQPRGLLAAISAGLPVIATSACGLPSTPAWSQVEAGDSDGLRAALLDTLDG